MKNSASGGESFSLRLHHDVDSSVRVLRPLDFLVDSNELNNQDENQNQKLNRNHLTVFLVGAVVLFVALFLDEVEVVVEVGAGVVVETDDGREEVAESVMGWRGLLGRRSSAVTA